MKKIITMVGTSLFENYMEDNRYDTTFKNYAEDLKEKSASEYSSESMRINSIKRKTLEWFKNLKDKSNASAEIKSLIKLQEELKENFEVHLLSSDTILSKLAGEILKENIIREVEELKGFDVNQKVVKNLQVKDRERFASGMCNLITEMYGIANYDWSNIIINITGGYKATIPYLSILAQVNKCPIYYIFEETDALIKVPYIPLDINWRVFEENEKFFMELEIEEIKELPYGIKHREEIESLIERADNLISLNPLGIALWEKYKERFNLFLISESVKEYIKKSDENYKNICEKSFLELKRRLIENPEHPDLNHSLKGINLREFKCFKHKEENLQVRILYKTEERETRYRSRETDIYIGSVAIGNEVHNAGSNAEYVEKFEREIKEGKITNFEDYKVYKI